MKSEKNIVLTGFGGAGKTMVGRLLAERLDRRFIDIHEIIEGRTGEPAARLAQVRGEAYLQELETEITAELAGRDNCVIATTSATILFGENYDNLRRNGIIIYLAAEPSLLILRMTATNHSSVLLKSPNAIGLIRKLVKEREPFYIKADHTIDTSYLTPEQVADLIIEKTGLS